MFIEMISRGKTLRLRRIGYRDAETGKRYEFLTNHFRLSARTIADIYKQRWRIEMFFREIKQNLRIKSFVGNTENAVSYPDLHRLDRVSASGLPKVPEQNLPVRAADIPAHDP